MLSGPQRAEQPIPRKDGRAFEPGSAPGPENPARGKTSERKDFGRPAGGRESWDHGQQRRLPPEPGEQILKTGYQSLATVILPRMRIRHGAAVDPRCTAAGENMGAARTHALRTDYKRIRRPIKGTCAEAN